MKAFGEAETGREATVDDVFRIGSVTKTFTANVVLQMFDEGQFGLDDTVATVAPKVAQAHPQVAELTVRQLLGMTSGLPDYLNVPNGIVAAISKDPSSVWSSDQLIDAGTASGVEPAGTPGYSTTNYIVLQQMVEEVSGQSLQELIASDVAGPLGTKQLLLPPNEDTDLPDPAAHGYLNTGCVEEIQGDGGTAQEGQDTTDWNASYGQGGGGMQATITDLGMWGAADTGNALLKDPTATERSSSLTDIGDAMYGLGIMDYGDGFQGHSGEAIGWQAQVSHNDQTGVTVALATNACNAADGLIFDPLRTEVAQALNPTSSASASATP